MRSRSFGIESSPSFVREPEGNGVAERFIRTLKENLLWVRSFETIEELRLALLAFKRTYNKQWMLEKYDYRSPAQCATRPRWAGRGCVEANTVKPLSKNPGRYNGIQAAFAYLGGVTDRVVLDNTTIAVKRVLTGRDRVQTDAFQAFRGAYPFAAAFCAPAKGWEKGSVETGVKYVRNLVFRPRPTVASWAALNALIITELEADLATRRLADGRPVREAWTLERRHLRARPVHLPETCRVEARVVDKFGHVRADRVTYSVPTRYAYRPVWVKLYHDRVAVAAGTEVVARHVWAFRAGATVLDPLHVLPVLERKHRAVPEATALQDWALAPVWQQVRTALRQQTRKPDQEWVRMLRLLETYPAPAVEAAVAVALARDSPRLETVRLLLRQRAAGPRPAIRPVPTVRADLARVAVPAPTLAAYDVLTGGRL